MTSLLEEPSFWEFEGQKFGRDLGYRYPSVYTIYTLWLFNSSPWYRWPIEIDGVPIKNGDFPWLCNKLPEGIYIYTYVLYAYSSWTWSSSKLRWPKTSTRRYTFFLITRMVKAMVWWLYPILSPFYPHCSPLGLNGHSPGFCCTTVSMYFSTQDGNQRWENPGFFNRKMMHHRVKKS